MFTKAFYKQAVGGTEGPDGPIALVSLDFPAGIITPNSFVHVSICEAQEDFATPGGIPWLGDATMTVHNVVPQEDFVNIHGKLQGLVLVRVSTNWPYPLNIRLTVSVMEPEKSITDPFALIGTIIAWGGGMPNIPDPFGISQPTVDPFGQIPVPYGDSRPTWLPCDGRILHKDEYPELFSAIAYTWGSVLIDNDENLIKRNMFRLPDLQGRFLRGWDLEKRLDHDKRTDYRGEPPRNDFDFYGTYEDFSTALPRTNEFITSLENHAHTHGASTTPNADGGHDNFVAGSGEGRNANGILDVLEVRENNLLHTHTVAAGGDSETRPVNAAVIWLIRAR